MPPAAEASRWSPRAPEPGEEAVVTPPDDWYYATLGELVRNIERLPSGAPTFEVLKAHAELSELVRQTVRECMTYADYLIGVEFRDGETSRTLDSDDRLLSGLLADDGWGNRFRESHHSDQTLHLALELSLRDLCWALSTWQPRSRLALLGEQLLDNLRADIGRHQKRAALWAGWNRPESFDTHIAVDPDHRIGWTELPTEFVHWRFSQHPDVDYWKLRNRLLLAELDSDDLGYVNDLMNAVTQALPASLPELVANQLHPRDLIEKRLSAAGFLEVPFSVPGPDTFPLHVPDYVDRLHQYEAELTAYVASVVGDCLKYMQLDQSEASTTSLRQLWNLGLPHDGPRR